MLDRFGKCGKISMLSLSSTLRACGGQIPQDNFTNVLSARVLPANLILARHQGGVSDQGGCAPCFR